MLLFGQLGGKQNKTKQKTKKTATEITHTKKTTTTQNRQNGTNIIVDFSSVSTQLGCNMGLNHCMLIL